MYIDQSDILVCSINLFQIQTPHPFSLKQRYITWSRVGMFCGNVSNPPFFLIVYFSIFGGKVCVSDKVLIKGKLLRVKKIYQMNKRKQSEILTNFCRMVN